MRTRTESGAPADSAAPADLLARLDHRVAAAGASRGAEIRSESSRSWAIPALAIAVTAVASSLLTCGVTRQAASVAAATDADGATAPPPVTVAADPGVTLEVAGYVVARNKASVSSDITGRVKTIHVVVGQKVAKGDVIAELDDREARLRLAAAELTIVQTRLTAQGAGRALDFQRNRLAQIEGLRERQFVSDAMYDEAEASYDSARIEREASNVAMAESENSVRAARIFVERHVIRAPFDGVVVEVSARPGETVSPTSSGNSFIRTGIVQLVDPVSLYVVAEVPERQVQPIRVGQPVDVVGKSVGGEVFPSKVVWVAPISNRQRGVVEVGVDLTDPSQRFIDGMEVDVRFRNQPGAGQRQEGRSI